MSHFFVSGGVDETVLSAKEQQLLDALSPAEAQGIEIVTVDIVGSNMSTIRVYLTAKGEWASMS